jgi:hypothetical protein
VVRGAVVVALFVFFFVLVLGTLASRCGLTFAVKYGAVQYNLQADWDES